MIQRWWDSEQRPWNRRPRARFPLPMATARRSARGGLLALALAVLLTVVLLALRADLSIANVALLYLLPVLAGATVGGLIPGVVASVLCTLAFDLLFIRPYGTLTVQSGQDVLTLGLYLSVGALAAELAARARARTEEVARRAATTALLYDLSSVFLAGDLDTMLYALVERLTAAFSLLSCAILLPNGAGVLQTRAHAGMPLVQSGSEEERHLLAVAGWAHERDEVVGLSLSPSHDDGPASAPTESILVLPLRTGRAPNEVHTTGVLTLARPARMPLTSEERRLLETFATQAALAVDRARLAEESAQAVILRESDRAKTALLSNVSHDLRTPLTVIGGAAESLLADDVGFDASTRRDLLTSIRDESGRLTTLVSNLLNLSRLEAGALRPDRHLYHLPEIVSRVLGRMDSRLAGHQVRTCLDPGAPAVLLDYLLVEQVLVNLLDNAIKYTPAGSTITIDLRVHDDQVVLGVSDNGPGIPPADRERVFERFYRLPGEAAHRTPGTGLGLAICQAIIQAHGGNIAITDGQGTGVSIRVALPLAVVPAGERPAEEEAG
ncbi:MAG TPA: ATP-binding protein [Chloroflexota bacterium]|nr:ATP-binding protein [Chloroflexota bacterium]